MTGGRPFFRPLAQLIWILLMLVVATVSAFVAAPFLGGPRAFWVMARQYALHIARVWGVRHRMTGWEALPEDLREGRVPAIYIANHVSNLDPVILACHLPCRPAFLAKLEVAFVPVLGWAIWLSGSIFIDRRNRERAIRSMDRAAARIRGGLNLVAFPEGTRSRTGTLVTPFKKGVFNVAMQAGVPIVPMGLTGTFAALAPGGWRVTPGPTEMRVGQPLYPAQYADADALREAAEAAMAQLIAET